MLLFKKKISLTEVLQSTIHFLGIHERDEFFLVSFSYQTVTNLGFTQ